MKIYAVNTLGAGLDTLSLLSQRIKVDGVIGLSERAPSDHISGYVYQEKACNTLGIPFFPVASYDLNDPEDRVLLERLEIDVLIVIGWQRLLPEWLLSCCRLGAIGVHGSAYGLTAGRGRSPQNWALILGEQSYEIAIFWMDSGIDSGDVIASKRYTLQPQDDIQTSYYKASWHVVCMLASCLETDVLERSKHKAQVEEDAFYLPQRHPEDGFIDWSAPASLTLNLVRALAPPYPCARTKLSGQVVKIIRAQLFDAPIPTLGPVGEILCVFSSGEFLVRACGEAILVRDYVVDADRSSIAVGRVFASVGYRETMERIIIRHRRRYPDLPIAPALFDFVGRL